MSYPVNINDNTALIALAEKTLDIEGESVPEVYLECLKDFLKICPYDDNFIIELPQKGKPGLGGNGFGAVTCMEEHCWKDIILDADPDRPQGGKEDGIGCFYNYQTHCQTAQHIEGRNKRLKKIGVGPMSVALPPAIFPQAGPSSQPALSSSQPDAGPSSLALRPTKEPNTWPSERKTTSSLRRNSTLVSDEIDSSSSFSGSSYKLKLEPSSSSSSSTLAFDVDSWDDTTPRLTSAKGKGRALNRGGSSIEPIFIDSGSEDDSDEVTALKPDEIPKELRKVTNKSSPFVLESDDDEEEEEDSFFTPSATPGVMASSCTRGGSSESVPPSGRQPSRSIPVDIPLDMGSLMRQDELESHPMPRDWFTNELNHLQNEKFQAIGTGLRFRVDPTRPRVEAYVNRLGLAKMIYISKEMRVVNSLRAYPPFPASKALADQRSLELVQYDNLTPYKGPSAHLIVQDVRAFTELWDQNLPWPHPGYQVKLVSSFGLNQIANSSFASPFVSSRMNGLSTSVLGGYSSGGVPGQLVPRSSFNDHDYGFEADRPSTTEGFSDLFKTALDDFQEDTDVETALNGLGLDKLENSMDGLSVQLMPHQVIGVHWMVKQEKKPVCAGGILGDQMGLGKTVQTIATMVKNPSQDRKIKSTLIVVPLALMQQWKSEIETKSSSLNVLIYHGHMRTKSINLLKNADCVITTYAIVANEGAAVIKPKRKKKRAERADSFEDESEGTNLRKLGPLFRMAWYRVILDEAAVIRNKATKASQACTELNAVIKWCLTGTLIYNNLTDIFPYLRFVGTIDWEDFRRQIHSIATRKPRLASKRAQALLRKVMLRRTKDSEMGGKKILQLPPKTTEMVEMDFTAEERAIYRAVETAARVRVNKWFKAGTILKHYHVVLVLLTRLRQLCCHPWLLRASKEYMEQHNVVSLDETGALEQMQDDDQKALALKKFGEAWVDQITRKLEERHKAMMREEGTSNENDYTCPICFDPYSDERITACQHSFCAPCIDSILSTAPRENISDDQVTRGVRPCPLCRKEITGGELFRATAFFDPKDLEGEEDVKPLDMLSHWVKMDPDDPKGKKRQRDAEGSQESKRIKMVGKGKAKAGANDEQGNGEPVNPMEVSIDDVLPSTKMNKIGEVLDTLREKDPEEKTLIFCSFVEMLELMAVFLAKRGYKYVLYTGKTSAVDREKAIRDFTKHGPKTPTVMLISLKCGGVGLNLTAANNVIGLDLAWSPASEAQAVDRAHRIGQTRPVVVKRLIIRESVEQRILELQDKKQMLMDGAMGEGNGGRLGRLSASELVQLFGTESTEDD